MMAKSALAGSVLLFLLAGCASKEPAPQTGRPLSREERLRLLFAPGEGWTRVDVVASQSLIASTTREIYGTPGTQDSGFRVDLVDGQKRFTGILYTPNIRLNFPITLSPDQRRLVVFCTRRDKEWQHRDAIDVYDLETGERVLSEFMSDAVSVGSGGSPGLQTPVAWSPDGSELYFYSSCYLRPDARTRQGIQAVLKFRLLDRRVELVYDGGSDRIFDFSLSTGGKLLIAQADPSRKEIQARNLWIYELAGGQRTHVPLPEAAAASRGAFHVAWHPDGERMAVADTKSIWFGPPSALKELYRGEEVAWEAWFDPTGKWLAVDDWYGPLVIDLATGRPDRILKATHSLCKFTGVSWSRDGGILAGHVSYGVALPRTKPMFGGKPGPAATERRMLFVADLARREVTVFPRDEDALFKAHNTVMIDDPEAVAGIKKWMQNHADAWKIFCLLEDRRLWPGYAEHRWFLQGASELEASVVSLEGIAAPVVEGDRATFGIPFRIEWHRGVRPTIRGKVIHDLARAGETWEVARTRIRFEEFADEIDVTERLKRMTDPAKEGVRLDLLHAELRERGAK